MPQGDTAFLGAAFAQYPGLGLRVSGAYQQGVSGVVARPQSLGLGASSSRLGAAGFAIPSPPISVPGYSPAHRRKSSSVPHNMVPGYTQNHEFYPQERHRFQAMAFANNMQKSMYTAPIKATLLIKIPGRTREDKLGVSVVYFTDLETDVCLQSRTIVVDIDVSYSSLQTALWDELEQDWKVHYPEITVKAEQTIIMWQNDLRLDRDHTSRDPNGNIFLGPGFIRERFIKVNGKKGPALIDRHKSSVQMHVTVEDEIWQDADQPAQRSVVLSKKVPFQ